MSTLAERLKEERAGKGWSQEQLADKSGVSQGTIGNIESGLRRRPREIVSIAAALGVRPQWLESGKGPKLADQTMPAAAPAEMSAPARQLAAALDRQPMTTRELESVQAQCLRIIETKGDPLDEIALRAAIEAPVKSLMAELARSGTKLDRRIATENFRDAIVDAIQALKRSPVPTPAPAPSGRTLDA